MSDRLATLTVASAIRTGRVKWLWQQRIPRRGVVVVAGEKGLGKSTLTNAYLVARLTRGELDGGCYGEPIDVAIATAEDDWRTVVVPRLMAHDADLDRVHRLELTDKNGDSLLTLPDDVTLVESAIDDLQARNGRTIGLLVIDPVTAFLSSSTDSHKDASVRRAIAPLAAFADRRDLAVLVVAHLTKDENRRVLSRVSGSGAFVNAARAVLVFARDPHATDGEEGDFRVLVMVASNWGRIAPSLAGHIEPAPVETDEGASEQPLLVLDGECEIDAGDLQEGASEATGDEVADAVLVALRDGPRASGTLKDDVASALRVSRRTVERAAKRLEDEKLLRRSKSDFPPVATWALTTPVDGSGVANGTHPAGPEDPGCSGSNSDTDCGRVSVAAADARDRLATSEEEALFERLHGEYKDSF